MTFLTIRELTLSSRKPDEEFQHIREEGRFEHDYYFLSQLYVRKWEPLDTI